MDFLGDSTMVACGFQLQSETEYLRHVIKHLRFRGTTCLEIGDGIREQSKMLTQDLFAFDCLIPHRTLNAYNNLKAKNSYSNPSPTPQQSVESHYPHGILDYPPANHPENPAAVPIFETIFHGLHSQEEDLIPPISSLVSMYDVLPFMRPNFEEGNIFPTSAAESNNAQLTSVNWKEILENFPSAVDKMSPDQIIQIAESTTLMKDKEAMMIHKPQSIPYQQSSKDISVSSTNVETISSDDSVTSDLESWKGFYGIGSRDYVPSLSSNGNNFKSIRWPKLALCETPNFLYTRSNLNGTRNKCCGIPNLTAHKPPAKVVVPATRKRTIPTGFRIPKSRKSPRKDPITNTREYYSSAYILEEGLKKKRASGVLYVKPYVCPVPKCGKSYKNANGIKYHAKYGHSAPQEFACNCGKMYNTMHSLLAHKKTHNLTCTSDSSADGESYNSSSGSSVSSEMSDTSFSGESEEDTCTCTE